MQYSLARDENKGFRSIDFEIIRAKECSKTISQLHVSKCICDLRWITCNEVVSRDCPTQIGDPQRRCFGSKISLKLDFNTKETLREIWKSYGDFYEDPREQDIEFWAYQKVMHCWDLLNCPPGTILVFDGKRGEICEGHFAELDNEVQLYTKSVLHI
ncbi:hypothetical protein POM88_042646 [Heracleum sosnowskyi]|uniref:Uncharacterized protein n=1 Tax=Heracleum sosnowskyi TaxID=360622 RepID=A0AAD8HGQ8_9APIA|nr:hypothetical protein POM88_042646 [Heracleum sosnowskyi]